MCSTDRTSVQRRNVKGEKELIREGKNADACQRRSRAEGKRVSSETLQFAAIISLMALISYFTMPATLTARVPTVGHVWYYGWLAALSTGLGALPLLFFSKPSDFWLGASNAIAAGMMLSASYSLVTEGVALDPDGASLLGYEISHVTRVIVGVILGMVFVRYTKSYVEGYEDLRLGDITGLEAAKICLIVSVMTLHSFAEGLGIGVSFCGKGGAHLGAFISASLAVHNVPEGLAVALVLVPRGVPKFQTFAMAICSSLPQPLIAVPVYLFVEQFIVWEPVGLGFAAGAMFWVACFELISDAIKEMSIPMCSFSLSCSFAGMMAISAWIDVVTAHPES
ncbi:hypothetical protein GUITHDRAFT_98030 [Guillardia theta CCMP2712]|uniref:Uncharacterized protein n=1 Tax=Guillardia theta (strain CCMP2712) TaxID=905079 RepID=L1IEC6_GUITC|nr:hypothetical protein GUITHDRAFT_98030 [Guillardia theta CCMP2712]EKX34583.1 hypothetical protein GUITHDRAFT_98030 [Guillardia theta CCMP2712]|mmetsp:Transcript_26619/g.87367  ORF Transcript_26619/g.87367 Transcript_26619/m.87367 type:complete len:338 (-) Transcript_26619:93-1106(-)|eukprot:XP_005821563.1 hypothetical protein GUITHDRAFT_98030 [Guillardia theta CCMP2712]